MGIFLKFQPFWIHTDKRNNGKEVAAILNDKYMPDVAFSFRLRQRYSLIEY